MTGTKWRPIFMWSFGLAFAILQFLAQLTMGHLAFPLMQSFNIDAIHLSYLSSCFFYTFLLMQIPAGILLDRFGPRMMLSIAMCFFGVGCIIFATSQHFLIACFGRLLMGMGSAFGFIGMLCLAAHWFAEKHFALMVGIGEMFAMLFIALAQYILPGWLVEYGWRELVLRFGYLGLGMSILTWTMLRIPKALVHPAHSKFKNIFKNIISNKQAWLNGTSSGLICTVLTVFCGLWGVPYLIEAHTLNDQQAGIALAVILLGIALGAPLLSYYASRSSNRRPIILACIMMMISVYGIVLFGGAPSIQMLYAMLFVLGMVSSCYVLFFAIAKDICDSSHTSTMMGFVNLLTMSGAIFIQPLVGYALEYSHKGPWLSTGVQYVKQDYQFAMSILFVCFVLSLICSAFVRDKESYSTARIELS